MNVREARKTGSERLRKAGIDTPQLDTDLLLCHALGWKRSRLLAYPEFQIPAHLERQFMELLLRREAREPLAYITGAKEFYGLTFVVTPDVLIPRPETELLVDLGLAFLKTQTSPALVVDAGTGSGALAVSLAVALRRFEKKLGGVDRHSLHEISSRIVATDRSLKALAIATKNARRHEAEVTLIAADLIKPIKGPVQLIVANLPYIPSEQIPALQPEIKHYEPLSALDGGVDGLDCYRRLLTQARSRIDPRNGMIIMEIEADQGRQLVEIAKSIFPGSTVNVHQDLAGLDRAVTVSLKQ